MLAHLPTVRGSTISPISQFTKDRKGENSDLYLVQRVLRSLINMSCYERTPLSLYLDAFQKPFLSATYEYYHTSAEGFLAENPTSLYVAYALEAVELEQTR